MHESTVSSVFGFLIIIIVGLLVVNYFRNLDKGEAFPEGASTENQAEIKSGNYVVKEGESLWTIAEEVYKDGFKWTQIAEANNLKDPNGIEVGQELIIPESGELAVAETSEPTATPEVTAIPKPVNEVLAQEGEQETTSPLVAGESYKVQKGDNLWNIAEAAYGDGFKWVDIAEANHLANPRIIHAGNDFVIPR